MTRIINKQQRGGFTVVINGIKSESLNEDVAWRRFLNAKTGDRHLLLNDVVVASYPTDSVERPS
jgi:hypothetical protein